MHIDVSGSCHCGAVSFSARVNPEYVVMCHCTDCQTISSAPYKVSVPVLADNLHLTGELSRYVKMGGSGTKRLLTFCGVCGSAVYSTSIDLKPDVFTLRWGLIDQRAELPPRKQGFCGSGVPWAMDIRAIPEVPTSATRLKPQ